ncbi:MAG: hypothetical protein ACTSRW_14780 [Candidatus Helarchaeota archaeon]
MPINWYLWDQFIFFYNILMTVLAIVAIIHFFMLLNDRKVKLNIIICLTCAILIISTSIVYMVTPIILQFI